MISTRTVHVLSACLLAVACQPAGATTPCSDAVFHQFAFWLGDWQVRQTNGTFAGMNRITQEYGGCVVHEHYTTGRGYSGESLNIYDATRKVWHQTWVDSTGLLLVLEGHLVGRNMILEDVTRQPDGSAAKQRITWAPNPDGSVRQFWEATDAKGQWVAVFDGRYTIS